MRRIFMVFMKVVLGVREVGIGKWEVGGGRWESGSWNRDGISTTGSIPDSLFSIHTTQRDSPQPVHAFHQLLILADAAGSPPDKQKGEDWDQIAPTGAFVNLVPFHEISERSQLLALKDDDKSLNENSQQGAISNLQLKRAFLEKENGKEQFG
jgi:hypothetical protein